MNPNYAHRRVMAVLTALLLLLFSATASATALAAEGEELPVLTEATSSAVTEPAAPIGAAEVGETAAEAFGDFLTENAAELISGATLGLTLFITLFFRKKLLPGLLETLTGLLGKSRETCELIESGHTEEKEELSRILARAEEVLAAASLAVERAEGAAESLRAGEGLGKETRLVLLEQSELLYELLMSANLPQYQKDRIGEAHAAATACLRAESGHE